MEQSEIDALLNNIDVPDGTDTMTTEDQEIQFNDEKNLPERNRPSIEVHGASFEEAQKDESPKPAMDLDFILDIPLSLSVELGRSRMLISELLQLGQGSVIELAKLAGEPMDVFINQRLIARGEVVVVNEKFGVRLTDIISPAERINKLK
jgi:flagellar motor switch protein FliN/FliY